MPIRSQDCLNLLRPLIDTLIPRQPGLRRETRHGLNQLLHLIVQQMLAVAGLESLHLIRRTEAPILNGDLIGRAVNRQPLRPSMVTRLTF